MRLPKITPPMVPIDTQTVAPDGNAFETEG